jgi:hypothetical protein
VSSRDRFGEVPFCNIQGKGISEVDEFDYFSRPRVNRIIDDLS